MLIGRFGIDQQLQGKGLGRFLFYEAMKRCLESSRHAGATALIVRPLNESAKQFYKHIGFISF